jgi:hypothetical protein
LNVERIDAPKTHGVDARLLLRGLHTTILAKRTAQGGPFASDFVLLIIVWSVLYPQRVQ